MLTDFICPDGARVRVNECFKSCRTGKRCMPLPVLYRIGRTRDRSRLGSKFSVTEIINPYRYTYLMTLYPHAEPPLDGIWKVLGSAGHYFLDQKFRYILTEERISNGLWSGQIDAYDEDGVLWDYKFVSVWKAKNWQPNPNDSWTIQINAYRELLEGLGFGVKEMKVVIVCRDWRQYEAGKQKGYPAPLVEFSVPKVEVKDLLLGRLMALYWFISNKVTPPYCDDVWEGIAPEGKRCLSYCAVRDTCLKEGAGLKLDLRF